MLGIHFEGPYLSPARAGVHDVSLMGAEVDAEVKQLLANLEDVGICLITVAAEVLCPNAIRALRTAGAHVAIGHSNASGAQAAEAIAAGANLATHLFNAMSTITAREPGVVGAFLAEDEAYVDIIADGYHVDFMTVKVALNAKPAGKVFLVTDAMPPVGGSGIGYTLGPHEIFVSAGECVTADGVLAGSALDMATAVRNVIHECGIPKDEALRMASLYPAEYLGISDQYGRVAPGVVANMVIVNNEVRVAGVVASGEYEAVF